MKNSPYPSPRPRVRFRAITPAASSPDLLEGELSNANANANAATRLVAEPGKHGRKREPNKGSFQKETSSNPKGRPKGAKGAKAMVRKAFSVSIDMQTARGSKKVAIFEALLKKEVSLAAEGDWRARRTVFELGKWAFGDSAELPPASAASPDELTETGRHIIEWFEEEIKAQGSSQGEGL